MGNEIPDRRRGPDKWVKTVRILGYVSLGLLIGVLIIIIMAKPYTESFFDRFSKTQVFSFWNEGLLQVAFIGMMVMALISLVGLFINYRRSRRKKDKFSATLIMSMLVSLISCALYFVYFLI